MVRRKWELESAREPAHEPADLLCGMGLKLRICEYGLDTRPSEPSRSHLEPLLQREQGGGGGALAARKVASTEAVGRDAGEDRIEDQDERAQGELLRLGLRPCFIRIGFGM